MLRYHLCVLFRYVKIEASLDPYPAILIYLNFHTFRFLSRYRDSQLQKGEN